MLLKVLNFLISRNVEIIEMKILFFLNLALTKFFQIMIFFLTELTDAMKILQSPASQDPNANQDDIDKIEYAFECIDDWIGQIDMANNFHKIGGFHCLKKCLKSPHEVVRCGAANVIAELCQKNPYYQEKIVEDDFLPILMDIFANDDKSSCRIKARTRALKAFNITWALILIAVVIFAIMMSYFPIF